MMRACCLLFSILMATIVSSSPLTLGDVLEADKIQLRAEYLSQNNLEDILADISELPPTETDTERAALLQDSVFYSDSVWRHFYYVIPEAYDGERAPLIVWLHGGVSTENLSTYDEEVLTGYHLFPRFLEEGYLLALPCAQLDAVWWDRVGEEGILSIIRYMKTAFSIDDDRIYVGGFSDGASGCFSLMMLHPSYFAAYFALSGHIGVAAIDGERGTCLPTLYNRRGFVTHTDQDGLYPTGKMSPTIDLAGSAGADIIYRTFDGYEHDPAYLPLIEEELYEFLRTTIRSHPETIVWESSEPGRCDWLAVDSIIPWPLIGTDADWNMILVSDRLMFGFFVDWEYEADGVRISAVADGDVPAVRAGLQGGDVITGFMGTQVFSMDDVYPILSDMLPGDPFTLMVERDGETLQLSESFNMPEYYWLLPRTAPSVRVDASVEDNVFDLDVNRLCVLRLLLHREMIDFPEPVTVRVNGMEVFSGMVTEDSGYAMETFITDRDRERVYTAELVLDLEDLLPPLMLDTQD